MTNASDPSELERAERPGSSGGGRECNCEASEETAAVASEVGRLAFVEETSCKPLLVGDISSATRKTSMD